MSSSRDMYAVPSPPGEAPPPLPPGPPPGPAPPLHTFRVVSHGPTPLPDGPPPRMYAFGANDSTPRPGFSFQTSQGPSAQFPEQVYSSWPNQSERLPPPQGPSRLYEGRRQTGRFPQREEFNQERRQERLRGRPGTRAPASRPLLTSQRGTTPEQMSGMTEEDRGGKRFISLDDLSDSQEEDMDVESQLDAGEENGNKEGRIQVKQSLPEDMNEPPRKRQAQGLQRSDDAASLSVPKWSNPDPYTALPPPDESQRKKKDVVKLIRKARVASTQRDNPSNGLEANADFISLSFGDDAGGKIAIEEEDDLSEDTYNTQLRAPSGPQSLSRGGKQQTQNKQILTASTEAAFSTSIGQPPISLPERPPAADDALGSRKRTHRDEIKETGRPRPRTDGRAPSSELLPAWHVKGNVDPVPWCDVDHSTTQNLGFWLHKEICDFYTYVRPRKFEQEVRENLLERLQSTLVSAYPDCKICCFGSFPAGIYLPTADMDVVCVTNHLLATGAPKPGFFINEKFLRRFAQYLESKGLTRPGSIEVIAKAKVPIVKYVDLLSGLRVDMSFENPTGIGAVDTYLAWKHEFPAMPIIVTIIKQFLAMRGLDEVRSGGLGGFSITCMVTSLLQNMPQVQSHSMIPEHHLGDILMEFLDLYGKKFNTITTGIRLSPPGYFDKGSAPNQPYRHPQNLGRLTIQDPNNPNNDISGGSKNIGMIFFSFARAYDALQEKMYELHHATFSERRGQSILGTILAGNYSSFELQRERSRRVHEGRSEAIPEPSQIVIDNAVQQPPGGCFPRGDGNAKEVGSNKKVVAPPFPLREMEEWKKKLAEKRKKARDQKKQEKQNGNSGESPSNQSNQAKQDAKTKRQNRARELRARFPHIKNIPAEVGKALAKSIKQYGSSVGTPSNLNQKPTLNTRVKHEETISKSAKRQRTPEQPGRELQTAMEKRIRTSEEPLPNVVTRSMTRRLQQTLPNTASDKEPPILPPVTLPKSKSTIKTAPRQAVESASTSAYLSGRRKTATKVVNSTRHFPLDNPVAPGLRGAIKGENKGDLVQAPQPTLPNAKDMVMRSRSKPGPEAKDEYELAVVRAPKLEDMTIPEHGQASGAGARIKGNDIAGTIVKRQGNDEVGASTQNPIMLD